MVLGKVTNIRFSMLDIEINSPYSGFVSSSELFGRDKKDLTKYFNIGDTLFLKVLDVDEIKKAKLGVKNRRFNKLRGGIIVKIAPTKVPRLIGKKGSMINAIKEKTECKIMVGQNGLVWVKGDEKMQEITKNIIKEVEKKAHTKGLTDYIKNKLSLIIDGKLPEPELQKGNDNFYRENILEKPKLQNFKEELELEEFAEEFTKKYEEGEVDFDEDIFEDKLEQLENNKNLHFEIENSDNQSAILNPEKENSSKWKKMN